MSRLSHFLIPNWICFHPEIRTRECQLMREYRHPDWIKADVHWIWSAATCRAPKPAARMIFAHAPCMWRSACVLRPCRLSSWSGSPARPCASTSLLHARLNFARLGKALDESSASRTLDQRQESTHALGSGLRRRCRRPNPMEYRSNDTLPSNSPPQRSRSCLVTRLWNPNRRYRASERRSGMGSPKDCADQYLFRQSGIHNFEISSRELSRSRPILQSTTPSLQGATENLPWCPLSL